MYDWTQPYPETESPPPEVWSGSPAGDIDAANRSAPYSRVYATPEDNAYIAEQRGQAMLDPRYLVASNRVRVQAEEDAMRFAGQREFAQLVAGGATPEEAMRRTAGKLFWNHPDKMAAALAKTPGQGVVPTQLNAVPMMAGNQQIGNAVYDPHGRLHSTQFTGPMHQPPDVVAGQKMLAGEIDELERDLNRQRKALEGDRNNQELARTALATQQRLEQMRQQYVTGSTNWMGKASQPPRVDVPAFGDPAPRSAAVDASPFKEGEIVRNKKDGKRYRIVNGQPVPL